ncbi:MAG: glutamate 5-kinase [Verrucomicrobiota bacterium]|nr:glutamate 5-kinase [Verrucomicrobiota bacterium]
MLHPRRRKRIVIKLGTGVLTTAKQHHDIPHMTKLVKQIAYLVGKLNWEVLVVSSSAVCGGMPVLGFKTRPLEVPEIQACAAIGQSRLMTIYQQLFSKYKINVAQVLLTHPDIDSRTRYRNAQNTLDRLLIHNVVPIINENDTVAVDEIKFGDNDRLSAYVSEMVKADLLVILSMTDGLMTSLETSGQLVKRVVKIDDKIRRMASGPRSNLSVGGMISKIEAAALAVNNGIPVIIGHGRAPEILIKIAQGKDMGTYFEPRKK